MREERKVWGQKQRGRGQKFIFFLSLFFSFLRGHLLVSLLLLLLLLQKRGTGGDQEGE